eukprot:scaffold185115_cov50-Cyclotella_meneghiniana.AAC.1
MLDLTVESVSSTNLQNKSQMPTTEEDEASFDFDDFEENTTDQPINREESVKRDRTRRFRPSASISAYTNSAINNKSFIADSKRSVLNDEELNNVRKAVANDVAHCINENMKTLGLLGALLSSWAVSIYAGEVPLDEGLCYGRVMLKATYVVQWVGL